MSTETLSQINQREPKSEFKSFPCKLMQILDDDGFPDIIQWLPHGSGFVISDKRRFAEEVLPKYFPKKSKFSSFNRKLNRWKFVKQIQGRKKASYFHPLFIRGNHTSCSQMSPEPQILAPRSPPPDNRSPLFGSSLSVLSDNTLHRNASSLSPPRIAEHPRLHSNRNTPIPSLDMNAVSVTDDGGGTIRQEHLRLRRRFTIPREVNNHLRTYMNMSFQQIQALQQSLERELIVTSIEMEDLRSESLIRIIPERRGSPCTHSRSKIERRPSMGARAA